MCPSCHKRFSIHPGPLVDRSLTPPPPDPQARRVRVRSHGVLLANAGVLEPESIQQGVLDPITGGVRLAEQTIVYPRVAAVAFWREIDPFGALAVVVLWLLAAALHDGFGLGVAVLAAWQTRRILWLKRWHALVLGPKGHAISVRFDRPWWNRKRFRQELLRRCGMPVNPMP